MTETGASAPGVKRVMISPPVRPAQAGENRPALREVDGDFTENGLLFHLVRTRAPEERVAVGHQRVGMVIDDRVPRAVELVAEEALGEIENELLEPC